MKTVVALYDNFTDAQSAIRDLQQQGVQRRDISLVAGDRRGEYAAEVKDLDVEVEDTKAGEGAATGAVTGGLLGGLGGVLVGLGALTIPGIGPIIAAGPIVAGLSGAAIGAVAGGIVGALIGWGIPEEEAHYYAEGIRRGGTLVAVTTPEDNVDMVSRALNEYAPIDLKTRSAQWRVEGWTRFDETNTTPYESTTTIITEPQLTADDTYVRSYDLKSSWDDSAYGDNTDAYSPYDADYRTDYDTHYRNSGYTFEQYLPAYRYGYRLATDPMYRDRRDWNDLEPDARTNWESDFSEAWNDFKDAVRHGWQEAKEAVS